MWFLWNLNPAGAEYGLPMAWTIHAALDADALRDALQGLVDRHPVLRTTYSAPAGEPMQVIHPAMPVAFQCMEASTWSAQELHGRLAQEAGAPFDLEHGPVFRTQLFSRGSGEHVLLLNCHHIAGDTWSLIVMMEELGALYQARVAGREAALPPCSLPYTAYVDWQGQLLASPRGEEHWTYWREQLASPPTLGLPTDRPRPPVQGHAGAGQAFTLDAALTARIRALARAEGVTFYTVLLAAFYVMLYRYTGQDDLVVGSPRFGRPPEGFERTVGYFASPCALRTRVDGEAGFTDFLHQVREVLVGSKEHQDFPFPQIVERMALPRDPSRGPVFQVAFTYQKSQLPHMQGVAAARMGFGGARLDLPSLPLESYPLEQRSVKFDLDLVVEEVDGCLRAVCWYDTALWNADSIGYLVGHYQALLEGAVSDPSVALNQLPLLTRPEQQAMAAWNATDADFPQDPAHRVFERHAARDPHAPALRFDGGELSYDELNRRANRLAHYLRKLGLRPGQIAGLSIERGRPELAIGVLAIMKAGGAYLPLDPDYPPDRLAFMQGDAGVQLLLTHAAAAQRVPAGAARRVLLDDDWDAIAQEPDGDLSDCPGADDLAYVIYTSGSTGRPKGVLLEHRGLANLAHLMSAAFRVGPSSRMLLFASSSFDASVSELFTALCGGACLCLAPKMALIPGSALVDTIRRHAITVVTLPPSVLALLRPGDVPTLETVVTAGEACSIELAQRWSGRVRLWNAYGPTETTVCATMSLLRPDAERISIGGPIPNMRVHVLDARLQPVPIGVPGELHVAGIGLARGYLGRPDLTAERFIAGPQGERMYKTGDLVRFLPDGGLEFLGRLDHQVKIRGFRIELGEVEAVIASHPDVREALVLAREEAGGGHSIAAYAIAHTGASLSVADLRVYAQGKLPDFMVPAGLMLLDAWPTTPNGKIDRNALPAPRAPRADAPGGAAGAAPRNGLERQLAAIWCEVLALQAVGIDDSFFDVGGHSLNLVEVEVALERTLGLTVPTMDLFRFPTIRALATHLRGGAEAPAEPGARQAPAADSGIGADIAIVGMAGRFPGADDVDTFWRKLCDGIESISTLSEQDLRDAGVSAAQLDDPRYVRRKGVLDDVARFDAPFFGYPPREALLMDPQQRLFLEVGWQALEHAGYDAQTYSGRIGVVGGTGRAAYMLHFLNTHPESAAELFQTTILNEKDFLATRLAYKLNLRGPALTVQTACSTSLVAVHLACQQLLQRDCDMALAGGVSIEVPHGTGYPYQEGHILSPDGHCRAFDADAGGTVRGSGGAAVVLKRLADAVRDGDTIWAVIKGSAINNDGAAKVGYTAPSVDGQAEVIEQALQRAGVDPRSIGLVEAHGTATPLGDPIEVAALTLAYRKYTADQAFCLLGSVKTNVGHLDAAAGVTGLIKAALAVHHGVVPATLHYQSANPKLDLGSSPFTVNAALASWPATAGPRRAAVSSFGIGGTNAHLVLEQAPESRPHAASAGTGGQQLLALSARSSTALEAMSARLAQHLRAHPDADLADVAHTLQRGRAQLPHRRIVVAADHAAAAAALALPAAAATAATARATAGARVTFLFPGQGLQKVGMGRSLYAAVPEFRACIDECAAMLQEALGCDLRALLYPDPVSEAEAARKLADTAITQPAMFVVEYALARQLMHWGVQPDAMMGHSLGEYVAACLAGVMSLPDALALVCARGQLIAQLPGGAMLAVEASAEHLQSFITGRGVDLAVVNGPQACVLAGAHDAIAEVEEALALAGLRHKRIPTSHAFHSAMLDPVLEQFRARVAEVTLHAPRIPYITNVTGAWVTDGQATDPDHWVRHMRGTVRFAQGLELLLDSADGAYLEVGPGQGFSGILKRHPRRDRVGHAIPCLAHAAQPCDHGALLAALGQLWTAHAASPAWQHLQAHGTRRRIPLPVYPFDRHRYWPQAREAAVRTGEPARMLDVRQPGAPGDRRAPQAQAVELRDEIERQVAGIFADVLGIDAVASGDNFFDLGGTSLSALNVLISLEQAVGREMPNALLIENPTVGGLARALRSGTRSAGSRLIGLRATGAAAPIFCIHPYGGHTTGYIELARHLESEQPVFGIQARGLQGEAAPLRSIEEMASDYIVLIKARQESGPYGLAGHSMGGCIAYEMAQQLTRNGDAVSLLALFDSRAQNASDHALYRNGAYGRMAGKDWISIGGGSTSGPACCASQASQAGHQLPSMDRRFTLPAFRVDVGRVRRLGRELVAARPARRAARPRRRCVRRKSAGSSLRCR
jgi:amino acid adenylation domain-containing protein